MVSASPQTSWSMRSCSLRAESSNTTDHPARSGTCTRSPVIADLYMPGDQLHRAAALVDRDQRRAPVDDRARKSCEHGHVQVPRARSGTRCAAHSRRPPQRPLDRSTRGGTARASGRTADPLDTACRSSPKISSRLRLSCAFTVTMIWPDGAVPEPHRRQRRVLDLDRRACTVAASAMSDAGSPMSHSSMSMLWMPWPIVTPPHSCSHVPRHQTS